MVQFSGINKLRTVQYQTLIILTQNRLSLEVLTGRQREVTEQMAPSLQKKDIMEIQFRLLHRHPTSPLNMVT